MSDHRGSVAFSYILTSRTKHLDLLRRDLRISWTFIASRGVCFAFSCGDYQGTDLGIEPDEHLLLCLQTLNDQRPQGFGGFVLGLVVLLLGLVEDGIFGIVPGRVAATIRAGHIGIGTLVMRAKPLASPTHRGLFLVVSRRARCCGDEDGNRASYTSESFDAAMSTDCTAVTHCWITSHLRYRSERLFIHRQRRHAPYHVTTSQCLPKNQKD